MRSQMGEMLDLAESIRDWAGGSAQAWIWLRTVPISAFGGRTAEALIEAGHASAVRDYIAHLETGGHG